MTVVIKAVGFANGQHCPHAGQYLRWFDFEYDDGRGKGEFTRDRKKALEFSDAAAAMAFWRTRSKVRPLRPDRRANRPLTALTVEIVP